MIRSLVKQRYFVSIPIAFVLMLSGLLYDRPAEEADGAKGAHGRVMMLFCTRSGRGVTAADRPNVPHSSGYHAQPQRPHPNPTRWCKTAKVSIRLWWSPDSIEREDYLVSRPYFTLFISTSKIPAKQ